MAVAISPADGSRVLSEEAPGLGLTVRVPAVAVISKPSAWVLEHVVRELSPFETGKA